MSMKWWWIVKKAYYTSVNDAKNLLSTVVALSTDIDRYF